MSKENRIVVVGSSCCGKTTFAKRLAEPLQIPHIELDALHWGPNWQPRPLDEFRRLVAEAIASPSALAPGSARGLSAEQVEVACTERIQWLIDGNYSPVRDLFWPQATQVIWLNYSFPTVMRRAVGRSLPPLADRRNGLLRQPRVVLPQLLPP